MPKVVILITTHKENLDVYETISLSQCFRIFKDYPIRIVCPEGVSVADYLRINPRAHFDFIDQKWFVSRSSFARLKILPFLYQKYSLYDYILFYEPDAFVFRDDLMAWCSQGFDYIGAPWFEGLSRPKSDKLIGVGNGGFSLRKTQSMLTALSSVSLIFTWRELCYKYWFESAGNKIRKLPYYLASSVGIRNNSYHRFNDFPGGEDIFWGRHIAKNFSWFKLADLKSACRFSFEVNPRFIWKMNHQTLPFGCHGWQKYDPDFWRPFIRSYGYEI